MSNSQLYPCTQSTSQYVVHLDATHIAEVRKQGEQLGIYTVTASGKKRGILLPIDTWHAIEKYRHLINVAVDLSVGVLTTDKVAETVFQHQQQQQQVQQRNIQHQVQGIKYIYPNNVCHRSRYANPCNRAADNYFNKQPEILNSSQNGQTTSTVQGTRQPTTKQPTTNPANPQHILDKQDGFETVPLMEYFGFSRQGGISTGCDESTLQEEETTGNVDSYTTTYVC